MKGLLSKSKSPAEDEAHKPIMETISVIMGCSAGPAFQGEWESSQMGWAGWELGKPRHIKTRGEEEATFDGICHPSSRCGG